MKQGAYRRARCYIYVTSEQRFRPKKKKKRKTVNSLFTKSTHENNHIIIAVREPSIRKRTPTERSALLFRNGYRNVLEKKYLK